MATPTLTVDDLPGVCGVERDNRRGLELFVASEIGEELMATAYLLMQKDGLLDTVFYESVPSLSEFISWLKRPNSRYLGGFVRPILDNAPVELAGLGWLWNIDGKAGAVKADYGFVYFRKFQRDGIPLELTEKMLDFALGVLGIDVLVGSTPSLNRAAILFTRKLGVKILGEIPCMCSFNGETCGSVISYITKKEWINGRRT